MSVSHTITFGNSGHGLVANPINPAWIIEGQPAARIKLLSSSMDGTASTYFWDCTGGRFNWFYSFDETFHVLEGETVLKGPDGESRRVTVGDTVFFPKGSTAEWTVDNYVRKLAFCRVPLPNALIVGRGMLRGVKRMLRGGARQEGGSGLL